MKDSKATLYPITGELQKDSAVSAFYLPYKKGIDSQMNAAIAEASVEITRKKPEGLLNNLVIDAMAQKAKDNNIAFDFVHTNFKGLRNPLPRGPIKAFKVYELMPFENYLVTVKLKGTETLELFKYIAARNGDPISGASLSIKNGMPQDIVIKGEPLDTARIYTVLTNDYLANGGDDAGFYKKALERDDSAFKLRDAILSYLKKEKAAGRVLEPKIEGRIKSDKQGENE